MTREIGSEYHRVSPDDGQGFVFPIPGSLVFSGRTAIETIIKEIHGAKKALLPSYCCHSMIQPFIDAGINVEYYPVNYDNGLKIEVMNLEDVDIFLWCNYFATNTAMPDLSDFSGVIIEDITHSLLSSHSYNPKSDYIVASLRKWEPINCGGYCAAVNGLINNTPTKIPPQEFIDCKTAAMVLKAEYLSDLIEEKKHRFLAMYEKSNQWIAGNYAGLSIDSWSQYYISTVDLKKQICIRRKNAKIIYSRLKEKVQFLVPEENMECALFVPILLPNRDKVRKILIENQIYCPIHWPKPYGCESNLYGKELSLVCDQRYNEEDMERLVSLLLKIL